MTPDLASLEGKDPQISAHLPVLVVGGGAAGLGAAKALAKLGIGTMLVDEHPVPPGLMALDVPLHFGQRMASPAGKAQRLEQIVESTPEIAEAYELGIDVQLGVCVWGIFRATRSTSGDPAALLVGLADEERSWFVSCDRLIIASGARDLAIGFPGWEKPGVMGGLAALQLIERYDAFTGSSALVLGGGALAHRVVDALSRKGIRVAGIVDVDAVSRGLPAHPALPADASSAPRFAGHVIAEARGVLGVESAVLAALDPAGHPLPGSEKVLPCDTIVLAIGAVPTVDLLDTLGCRMEFAAARGGWVPYVDSRGETSVAHVYAAGDCAGFGSDAQSEGSRVAAAVAASLAARPRPSTPRGDELPAAQTARPSPASPASPADGDFANGADASIARAREWMRAQIRVSGARVIVCQCEEVTRREILELEPPRYVAEATAPPAASAHHEPHSLRSLMIDGPLNQDQVKRLTRAGMGPCQGRRCREQIQCLLEDAAGSAPGDVPLARYRPPVRPLPMQILAAWNEPDTLRAHWVAWFNISTQWLPHWQVVPPPLGEAADAPVQGQGE